MAGIFVVMQLIVLGVQQMDSGMNVMEAEDLLLQRNELIPFLGVAGNREACDRKLDAPLWFDGCRDDGIVSEDLFRLVGIGRFTSYANSGVSIVEAI